MAKATRNLIGGDEQMSAPGTVGRLIDQLSQYDRNMPVRFAVEDGAPYDGFVVLSVYTVYGEGDVVWVDIGDGQVP